MDLNQSAVEYAASLLSTEPMMILYQPSLGGVIEALEKHDHWAGRLKRLLLPEDMLANRYVWGLFGHHECVVSLPLA